MSSDVGSVRRFDGHSGLRPFAHLAAAAAHEHIIDMGPGEAPKVAKSCSRERRASC